MLKKSVAFALALVMSLGQAPMTLLASEESIDTSLIPQVESSEVEGQSEESNTESVDSSGATASLETSDDTSVTEETTVEEPIQEGVTSEDSSATSIEDSLVTVTEAPAETTDGDFTDGSEEPTEEEDSMVEPEGNSTEVTPTPTQAVEEVIQFDYEGTYNALKSSWNFDRDTSRDSMLRNLVNKTGLVKYKYGAGHSATYFAEKGISDVADALYITENPEYLDDSGLVAWGYYQVGFKDFAQWVADYGLSGADDTDYLQSIEYAQILPGDIAVASDGWSAIYGGSLDGSPVYIGSYWAEDNGELGVCCDTEYRKDFVKFYRYTGLTDAIKEEEGTKEENTTEDTENTEETEVKPTEIPEEETTENTENTESTVLTYSDEDVDITATIENGETFGIEEFDITGLELKADAIEEGTEEYNAYVEEVTKSLGDAPEGKSMISDLMMYILNIKVKRLNLRVVTFR